jgi:hypothetical protein
MPPQTAGLRRVSGNPEHWRQSRRALAAQAAATGVLGAVGLFGVITRPGEDGWRILGVPLTPALSVVMLGIAAAAALASTRRPAAKVVTLTLTAAALALMIICSVAAAHRAPGPLGFTEPAILLWSILFCVNLGTAMWIIPDHIEGPAWLPRRHAHRGDGQAPT